MEPHSLAFKPSDVRQLIVDLMLASTPLAVFVGVTCPFFFVLQVRVYLGCVQVGYIFLLSGYVRCSLLTQKTRPVRSTYQRLLGSVEEPDHWYCQLGQYHGYQTGGSRDFFSRI